MIEKMLIDTDGGGWVVRRVGKHPQRINKFEGEVMDGGGSKGSAGCPLAASSMLLVVSFFTGYVGEGGARVLAGLCIVI